MIQHSPTILVVDDDEDIRAFLTDLLTGVGYGVDSAPDGGLALEMLQSAPTRFSLVLLDLMQLVDPANATCVPGSDGRIERLPARGQRVEEIFE